MTKRIRMSVSLDAELHAILARIAAASGKSIAQVVRDNLELGREALAMIALTLEHAAELEEGQRARIKARIAEAAERIAAAGDQAHQARLRAAEDMLAAARPGRRKGGPDPRIVTRGFRSVRGGGQSDPDGGPEA